jgi:hypothetical protein
MNDRPAPAYAHMEQVRADGLAASIQAIQADPHSPLNNVIGHYQGAYRDASTNAAAHAEQPGGLW